MAKVKLFSRWIFCQSVPEAFTQQAINTEGLDVTLLNVLLFLGIYEIFCKEIFGVKAKNLDFGLQPYKIPETQTVCESWSFGLPGLWASIVENPLIAGFYRFAF